MKAKSIQYLGHCLVASALLTIGGAAVAAAVTPVVTTEQGTVINTGAISTWATDGGDMAGMLITVAFGTGATETRTWEQDPADSVKGFAAGTGWRLSLSGNTDLSYWRLDNLADSGNVITGLTIDGQPGNTVFDYFLSPEYSPGSSVGGNIGNLNNIGGYSMTVSSVESALAVRGVYSDQLQVGGQFYGDLFLTLDMAFSGTTDGGLSPGRWLQFASDTDNFVVPEPATLALFGIGLLGMGFSRRNKS